MLELFKQIFNEENLKKNRVLTIRAGVVIFLISFCVVLSGRVILSYQNSLEVKKEIQEKENFISDWQTKTNMLSSQSFRPVQLNQLDVVQADILVQMQRSGLNLSDYKAQTSSKDKKGSFRAFSLSFAGSYEQTMSFLENFGSRDALINITKLSLSNNKGVMQTQLDYRIYVK